MKKVFLTAIICTLFGASVYAGDSSTFVNLGFSPDGKYFMFGQYGLQPSKGVAYAEMYLVDVNGNTFVSNGSAKGEYGVSFDPGQSALGALVNLLEANVALKERYKIDHLKTGRLLYVEVEVPEGETSENMTPDAEAEPKDAEGSEALEFRDFTTGRTFKMSLVQSVEGSGSSIRSSFYILMEVADSNGFVQTYTVGHPNFKRKMIAEYAIGRVIAGPDNRSLVIIISKKDTDNNIRYMVETVRLK
jgi:predicted secreted protein